MERFFRHKKKTEHRTKKNKGDAKNRCFYCG